MQELFSFVEPADQNLNTYSHRIQQLLTRCCIEVEANLTAILLENGYSKAPNDLIMRDYRTIEYSHKLSEYEVRMSILYLKEPLVINIAMPIILAK